HHARPLSQPSTSPSASHQVRHCSSLERIAILAPTVRVTLIPIAERAAPSAHITRGFVLWRLSDAGHCPRGTILLGRHPKPSTNPDVGASGGMAGSVAVDRQLPQTVVGGCGAEFVGEVLVDGSHQALAAAGCSFSARLVLLTCSPDYHRSNKKGPGLGVSGPGSCD